MTLLSVKNLTVTLSGRKIIDKVSFDVESGHVLAVVGPNGSGKSTLMKALLELLPYQGTVRWGKKVKIGYVPQQFDFDRSFPLTVRELFLLRSKHSFWMPSQRVAKEITTALKTVGAERLLDSRIGGLSGGELQRVLIAYSLMEKPDILFFDEPSSGIDVGGEETVYSLIDRLVQKTGLTVFLISHDLDVVFRSASRVLCINQKLVCEGIPREVLTGEMLARLYGGEMTTREHHHHYG